MAASMEASSTAFLPRPQALMSAEEAFDGLPSEQQERIQRVLDEEPDGEDKIERAALRLMAEDIRGNRRLIL